MSCQELPPRLFQENLAYVGTGGTSEENAHVNFIPAFQHSITLQVELARFKDGRIAPCHLVEGLPDDWVIRSDDAAKATDLNENIVSGFVRSGEFFTREQAVEFMRRLEEAS